MNNPASYISQRDCFNFSIELSTRAALAALVAAMLFITAAALCAFISILIVHLVHPPFAKDLLYKSYYFHVLQILYIQI